MTFKPEEWRRDFYSILSIDPGSSGTGIALWDYNRWKKDLLPEKVANLYPNRRLDWQGQAAELAGVVRTIMQYAMVKEMHIEYPGFFGGTAGGNASAETGSLVKLSILVGMFLECGYSEGLVVHTYPVNEWKGQMPKAVVEQRIIKRVGEDGWNKVGAKSHSIDAWGIGLFAKGCLKVDRYDRTTPTGRSQR